MTTAENIPMNGAAPEPHGKETGAGGARGPMTNAAWNVFASVWSMAISFVLAPLIIHRLGTEQYGILLLVWSVTGILGVMNIGMGEATLRYVAHYYSRGEIVAVNRVMGSSLSLMLVVSMVVAGGFLFATPLVAKLVGSSVADADLLFWLLRISALIVVLNVFSWTYSSVPMALHRYDILSKINMVQNVVRSGGYVLLVIGKLGVLHLLLWDLVTQAATLGAYVVTVRRITPDVRLLPSMSFDGLREIFGYSLSSLFCFMFLKVRNESGKILLGNQLGASPVAFLGTPDNLANRIHVLVASASETLMPRFSAERDPKTARELFLNSTWGSTVSSLVFLLPLIVLLPDFLRLWIGPGFARESATVGQWVALSYILHGAYAPAGAYFRGIGKPWFVTILIGFEGLLIVLFSLLLIPRYGLAGVGYAYVISSVPAVFGLLHCWYSLFGRLSAGGLMRAVGLPALLGVGAAVVEYAVLGCFDRVTWFRWFVLGGSFVSLTGLLVFGADWVLGGTGAPSKRFVEKIAGSEKLAFIFERLPFPRRAR